MSSMYLRGGPAPPGPSIQPEKVKKELLVFCLYLHTGNQSFQRTLESMKVWENTMDKFVKEIENSSNYKVSYLVLPQEEAETRLECVFPKSQEEMDMSIFNQLTEEKLLP